MWTPRTRTRSLDPYFRALYGLESAAVLGALAGMFLVWWRGAQDLSFFDLLNRSAEELAARDPSVLGQPLVVLWMIWPAILVSGPRSITGILVTPVSYRRLALVAWGAAMLALAHFYINFGEDIPERSPLRGGTLGPGFWLSGAALGLLGLLIAAEWAIRPRLNPFAPAPPAPSADAESAPPWRGVFQSCPFCGMLNAPDAQECYHCRQSLIRFTEIDANPPPAHKE